MKVQKIHYVGKLFRYKNFAILVTEDSENKFSYQRSVDMRTWKFCVDYFDNEDSALDHAKSEIDFGEA